MVLSIADYTHFYEVFPGTLSTSRFLGRPRQTSRREDHHIVRSGPPHLPGANCCIGSHPGTGSTFPRGLVSSGTIRRRLAEVHFGLRALTLTPTHRRLLLDWCC
ncbi:hypothetical protein TNCV_4906141 [Trichonephila clavipes]|uniref:Uncharacterized protein n=1 Tax=Trichonephila clavipes TaxID=2585209 RepID=A0A8X6V3J8_TRICX|nr:hypothetical protein TNCV_4906141 [Trichonephila clavipes]